MNNSKEELLAKLGCVIIILGIKSLFFVLVVLAILKYLGWI